MSGPATIAEKLTESARLRAEICDVVLRHALSTWGRGIRSVMITGSLARDEITLLRSSSGWQILGDADCIVAFSEAARLPDADVVRRVKTDCESELRERGISVAVSLATVKEEYFRRMPAHIFTYELLRCGHLVWGEDLRPLIPEFAADSIELEDAWRLLANRVIELLKLAVAAEAVSGCGLEYGSVKLFLDMGTSLLVFLGAYKPTYRERADRLAELSSRAEVQAQAPFPLERFAARVAQCTRWKLYGGEVESGISSNAWQEALEYAALLWHWELARMTGSRQESSREELVERLAGQQPAPAKIRGWLYVVRRAGWLRNVRHWPRWLRMAFRCSPRYSIYEAAWYALSDIAKPHRPFPAGGEVLQDLSGEAWERCSRLLPASHPFGDLQRNGAKSLIHALAWNYERFLMETRA